MTTAVVFALGMLTGAVLLATVIAFAELVVREVRRGGVVDDGVFRRIGRQP